MATSAFDPATGTSQPWGEALSQGYRQDPEYVAEYIAIKLMEQANRLMEDQGVSQSELANRIGVNRSRISRMLNAPSNLTLRSIAQVAIALGAEFDANLGPQEEAAAVITTPNAASMAGWISSFVFHPRPAQEFDQVAFIGRPSFVGDFWIQRAVGNATVDVREQGPSRASTGLKFAVGAAA